MRDKKAPSITLNNGTAMPILGLGVFQSKPEETKQAVATALDEGYRLIDTAAAYHNEKQVGEGIRQSDVSRSEIFVTSKLWMSDYGRDRARRGFDVSLRKLGLEYIDLYLLHWPMPSNFSATIGAYRTLEELVKEGRLKAIGVSNFSARDLDRLLGEVSMAPTVNQVELHPFFNQRELHTYHETHKIATEAWSPIGGIFGLNTDAREKTGSPLEHPVVLQLAEKHGKTAAQIVLRWHVEHNIVAIPKSTKPKRIAENLDIFDFALTSSEVASIDALDTGRRAGPDPDSVQADTFPITIED